MAPPDGRQYSGQFRVATYFPAFSVTRLLSAPEDIDAAIAGTKDWGRRGTRLSYAP